LHAVAELAEDVGRDIVGELRAEIHAHALGADQPHHLLDALHQCGRGVVEQQVRLVEDEDQLRLLQVAHFRQFLEQLGQQPQQEGRVQARLEDQLRGGEDADHPAAVVVDAHDVGQFQRRFAEELLAAVLRQAQQRTLDRRHRLRADQPVLGGHVLALLGHQVEQGAQVVKIEQQQAAVVGQLEHDVEHPGLGVVEFEDARQQGRPHLADRGPHRVAELAVQVPEHHRAGGRGIAGHADVGGALGQLLAAVAGHGQAGHVTLHVGQEHRHAQPREALGQGHQRHRLAGAGGAGHQAMAVAEARKQGDGDVVGDALADQDGVHAVLPDVRGWILAADCIA